MHAQAPNVALAMYGDTILLDGLAKLSRDASNCQALMSLIKSQLYQTQYGAECMKMTYARHVNTTVGPDEQNIAELCALLCTTVSA